MWKLFFPDGKITYLSKMMGTVELGFILVLLAVTGFAAFTFFKSYSFHKKLSTETLTRGMNGVAGSTIKLTCPVGQKIKVYKANYVCTSTVSQENATCDPYWQQNGQVSNFFNPLNTFDAGATLGDQCNGKQDCSITVPSALNVCQQTTANALDGKQCQGQIQLIGTYDCEA